MSIRRSGVDFIVRRPLRQRILSFIISDSVRNFIWIYYFAFFWWGFYGSVFAHPINLIVEPMGQFWYNVWVWTPIPATIIALGGLALRHGGSPADEITGPFQKRADFLGLWMQVGGHVCMFIVLLVFEITGIAGMYWGQPVFSVFLLAPYCLGVAVLAFQCVYKLHRGRRRRQPCSL